MDTEMDIKVISEGQLIEPLIIELRGKRVIMDADLARIYGTTTKRLNQAIKRNRGRFPEDFVFRLTGNEKAGLVTICDQFNNFKHLTDFPLAFTEHGAIQAANVLRSSKAVEMSVYVVRAFVKMRETMVEHKDIMRKIASLESRYDQQFKVVFDALRKLMIPPTKQKRRIGF